MVDSTIWHIGKVVIGHQAASGKLAYQNIGGSIKAQKREFRERGFNIDHLFDGTINIEIAPKTWRPVKSNRTFLYVDWHHAAPIEHFSFFDCKVKFSNQIYNAFIYLSHPETKKIHRHPFSRLEIIAQKIPYLSYGKTIEFCISSEFVIVSDDIDVLNQVATRDKNIY